MFDKYFQQTIQFSIHRLRLQYKSTSNVFTRSLAFFSHKFRKIGQINLIVYRYNIINRPRIHHRQPMSKTPKNAQNTQQLKILKNQLKGVEPKTIFDRIKTVIKQSQKPQQLQLLISKQLSLFLRRTVAVNVLPIKEVQEGQSQSHEREMHRYDEPSIILEDSTNFYRIWVQDALQFEAIKQFRKPASKEPTVISIKPQDYENQQ